MKRTSVLPWLALVVLVGLGLTLYWVNNRNITPASEATPCINCVNATVTPAPTTAGTATFLPPDATATWAPYPVNSSTPFCDAGCEATPTRTTAPTVTTTPENTATFPPVTRTPSATAVPDTPAPPAEETAPPQPSLTVVPVPISQTPFLPPSDTPTPIVVYVTVIANTTPATTRVVPTWPAPNVTVIVVTVVLPPATPDTSTPTSTPRPYP